jgi:hypothetical protein
LLPFRAALAAPEQRPFLVLESSEIAAVSGRPKTISEADWRALDRTRVAGDALGQLTEADAAMAAAKSCMAKLDETEALRQLARAEVALVRALALPGAPLFYAELQLQIGVTAAQLGATELASAAFVRAARIDPTRRLLAGEAAPDVVVLAARAFERAASAPESEVRVLVDVPNARVYVDDVERGMAPIVVRARTGIHVLRIEAEGRAPYAGLFEMAEGRRPEQRFALFRSARVDALTRLQARAHGDDPDALRAAANELLHVAPELAGVIWLEHAARAPRALLFACDTSRCRTPQRMRAREASAWPAQVRALSQTELHSARAWLLSGDVFAPANDTRTTPALWQRWYFWSALGAVVVGGAAAAIAEALQPEPQRTLRVTVNPSALH